MSDPKQNLAEVLEKIESAAKNSGRSAAEIDLVAVSKVHGADRIRPILEAGHRVFGENRVQEAQEKWPALRADYPDVILHLIGPLQTNKVRDAVALFDVIETVDREKLARKLAEEMKAQGRALPIYVQVNTGAEPQKAGVLPEEADAFIKLCRDGLGLNVVGLMAIPPADEEPSLHFMLLEKIAKRNGLAKLSMGMSGDYEVAVAFGATSVRVGTALFGARP
ncbi:MAG: YggS family pyridoxal phosphate-dependent enzyme [Alphaproteobacteria bacterium]|nr:MAG: YggS family pyridoxal phosphate-dependent enzyme [Alphaproteobacteria bacterium]